MRAREFVGEAKTGKIPQEADVASKGTYAFRDDGWDRTYTLNRVMMAAAMSDGKTTNPVDMHAASFVEKYNTASPFTKEESNMIKGALKTVGGEHKSIVGHTPSQEMPDTNVKSPVASFKGYKRK